MVRIRNAHYNVRRGRQRCSIQKGVLKISQNSQENTCARVFFKIKLQAWGLIKKETLAQVFSCEFCEISKNTFFTDRLWTSASNKVAKKKIHFLLQLKEKSVV